MELRIGVRIPAPELGRGERLRRRPVPTYEYVVAIAQLAEHLVVAQKVAGSSPTGHPFAEMPGPLFGVRAFLLIAD